jgi:hypothetical protein
MIIGGATTWSITSYDSRSVIYDRNLFIKDKNALVYFVQP